MSLLLQNQGISGSPVSASLPLVPGEEAAGSRPPPPPQNSSCGCGRCFPFQATESTQLLQPHIGAVMGFWAQTEAACKEKPQWKQVKGQPYPDSSYDSWKGKARQFEHSFPPQAVRGKAARLPYDILLSQAVWRRDSTPPVASDGCCLSGHQMSRFWLSVGNGRAFFKWVQRPALANAVSAFEALGTGALTSPDQRATNSFPVLSTPVDSAPTASPTLHLWGQPFSWNWLTHLPFTC